MNVCCELLVVLEEEPMRGVRVDLDLSLWQQAGQEVRVVRLDHGVAVPIGNEHGQLDGTKPLQPGVVRDAPGADCVVLGLAYLPRGWRVAVFSPGVDAVEGL